jgi:hypothetical protein
VAVPLPDAHPSEPSSAARPRAPWTTRRMSTLSMPHPAEDETAVDDDAARIAAGLGARRAAGGKIRQASRRSGKARSPIVGRFNVVGGNPFPDPSRIARGGGGFSSGGPALRGHAPAAPADVLSAEIAFDGLAAGRPFVPQRLQAPDGGGAIGALALPGAQGVADDLAGRRTIAALDRRLDVARLLRGDRDAELLNRTHICLRQDLLLLMRGTVQGGRGLSPFSRDPPFFSESGPEMEKPCDQPGWAGRKTPFAALLQATVRQGVFKGNFLPLHFGEDFSFLSVALMF